MENEAKRFLKILFPLIGENQLIELRLISEKAVQQRFYPDIGLIGWDELVAFNEQCYAIYFGVCPRSGKDGKKTAVRTLNCLWVDLDAKDFLGGKTEIAGMWPRVLGESRAPSMVIDSGHGYHLYWLLKEPVTIPDREAVQRCESVMRGLGGALNGDHTHNLDRLLRLPGSVNIKVPAIPVRCQIIEWNVHRRYELANFSGFKAAPVPMDDIEVYFQGVLVCPPLKSVRVPKQIKRLIFLGREAEPKRYPSNSEADWSVVAALLNAGYDADAIRAIFRNRKWAIGQKFRRQGDQYLAHTIKNASAFIKAKGELYGESGSRRPTSSFRSIRNWQRL